jgi:hypothetical protein
VVSSVDPVSRSLTAVSAEGTELHMGADHIGADKLAHGHAITGHRAQGSTVDVSYVLEDGGGRELAYVTISRARAESHVYLVAPDLAQAADRLNWAWDKQRRQAWALGHRPEQALAALVMERADLARSVPPDQSQMLEHVRGQQAFIETDWRDLFAGTGRWAGTEVAETVHALAAARQNHQEALRALWDPGSGLWARCAARRELEDASTRFDTAHQAWDNTGEPHARWLRSQSDPVKSLTLGLRHPGSGRGRALLARAI